MAMGKEQKEIRLLFKTLGINKSITQIQKLGNAVKNTTFRMVKNTKTGRKSLEKMTSATIDMRHRFQMWALSVMFFGMMLVRTFSGIMNAAMTTFTKLTQGQTEAAAAMQRLGVGIEFLKFSLGNAIATALEPLIPIIMNIIMTITDWVDQNPELVATIISLGLTLGIVLLMFGQLYLGMQGIGMMITFLTPAFTAFGAIIAGLSLPMLIIIGIIAALALAWATNFMGMRDVINTIIGVIVGIFKTGFRLIMFPIELFWALISGLMDGLFPNWRKSVKETIDAIVGFFKGMVDWLKGIFNWLADKLAWLNGILDTIVNVVKGIGTATGKAIRGAAGVSKGSHQYGGYIQETGLYQLHRGETVIPSDQHTEVGDINVTVNTTGGVNADELADIIMDRIRNYTNVSSRYD